jgi:hypothetical protein
MTDVTWKEPPERPSGLRFENEAREMRENPGHWLVLDTFLQAEAPLARSMGNSVKIGRYAALRPAGAFEARTATEPGKKNGTVVVNVYARYIGDGNG